MVVWSSDLVSKSSSGKQSSGDQVFEDFFVAMGNDKQLTFDYFLHSLFCWTRCMLSGQFYERQLVFRFFAGYEAPSPDPQKFVIT